MLLLKLLIGNYKPMRNSFKQFEDHSIIKPFHQCKEN